MMVGISRTNYLTGNPSLPYVFFGLPVFTWIDPKTVICSSFSELIIMKFVGM